MPEPAPADAATATAEAFHAAYPGGPHDAESLLVTPGSNLLILTKGDPGVALYRLPHELTRGRRHAARARRRTCRGTDVKPADRPTAADVSPDGRWVAVRTTSWVALHSTADLAAGRWREVFRADLRLLEEIRGEGITFADRNTLLLVGEGGGPFRRSGTFTRLTCSLGD